MMTIKEAILQALDDLKKLSTHSEVYEHIIAHKYYIFIKGKTPERTISSLLGTLVKNNDSRIKRIKGNGNYYLYYLSKYEDIIKFETIKTKTTKQESKLKQSYNERDLHKLLSSYLKKKYIL